MPITRTESLGKTEALFQEMVRFVQNAAIFQELRIDEVERGLFDRALALGKQLLTEFAEAAGDGNHGEQIQYNGKTLLRSETKKSKPYRSIFGVISVERYVYAPGPKKKVEWKPVDAQLGLPAGEQSYVLEDWMQRVCLKESFAEGVGSLRDLLGVNTSVRAAEGMNRDMAQSAGVFGETQGSQEPETEAEIVVLTADGKGVPMRRPLEERLREHRAAQANPRGKSASSQEVPSPSPPKSKRLQRGEKRTRKQMAYVGAVYSIAPFTRSAKDVLNDVCRQQREAERPCPQNKQVFAEMTRFREGDVLSGQERCFARLALSAATRAGQAKPLICLMDGQQSFWNLKESWFPRAVGILDMFHVLERLWKVAQSVHGEGSPAATLHVEQNLKRLLEGQVGCVIGLFKRLIKQKKLRGKKAKTVRETITYFENNRQSMKYDEYLAAGYPIGTGIVEGACRHFVKDRMELAGMRWEIEGAQAMLSLRALYLNDQWDRFIEYRIQQEQQSLYGQAA